MGIHSRAFRGEGILTGVVGLRLTDGLGAGRLARWRARREIEDRADEQRPQRQEHYPTKFNHWPTPWGVNPESAARPPSPIAISMPGFGRGQAIDITSTQSGAYGK